MTKFRKVRWYLGRRCRISSAMETATERAEREREEAFLASIPFDDEPVDDETRARLREPWDPATSVTLDEHFANRKPRAS